jgi:hypothetical protein
MLVFYGLTKGKSMPVLFARVELRGTPSDAIYEKLHSHLRSLNWYQNLPGNPNRLMPHAMYQANYIAEPDVLAIANYLKSQIETYVWTKALVLVIKESFWAQTTG